VTVAETVAMVVDRTGATGNASQDDVEMSEYARIHDSTVVPDSRIYERTSIGGVHVRRIRRRQRHCLRRERTGGRRVADRSRRVRRRDHPRPGRGGDETRGRFERTVLREEVPVGAGTVVPPRVTVGENVVGANATVTDDVPDGAVIRGEPGAIPSRGPPEPKARS
jgi:bifunctional N-acetylglucosamine-1-phosphate-uridyltransferase/glucosamine-1-phosphate-acetyltransferase GlmU-like protein